MERLDRRELLRRAGHLSVSAAGLTLLAGCGSLPGSLGPASSTRPGGALETTTLRIAKSAALCFAPQYLAEDILRAKGFVDVQYVTRASAEIVPAIAAGEIDMAMGTVGVPIIHADANDAVVMLGGVHVGCFELFANPSVRSISDLRGKTVAVTALGSGRHVHLSAMAAYVGVDPNRDFTWVTDDPPEAMRRFMAGEIDAFMANPPEPQELHARGVGRVILNTNVDRPWS